MIKSLHKFNNIYPCHLSEATRQDLLGKTKVQSPERVARSKSYDTTYRVSAVDFEDLLKKNLLTLWTQVGDYICVVAFPGFLDKLKEVIQSQIKPNVTLQTVLMALREAIDEKDLLVDCECFDFKFRFSYVATKHGYKYGKPETRPANIRNPKDNIGAFCKHLNSLLSNKRWLVKVASEVNKWIRKHLVEVMDLIGLDSDEVMTATFEPSPVKGGTEQFKVDISREEPSEEQQSDEETEEETVEQTDEEEEQ